MNEQWYWAPIANAPKDKVHLVRDEGGNTWDDAWWEDGHWICNPYNDDRPAYEANTVTHAIEYLARYKETTS